MEQNPPKSEVLDYKENCISGIPFAVFGTVDENVSAIIFIAHGRVGICARCI